MHSLSAMPKSISPAFPEEVHVASKASGPFPKTVHIPPFLKTITDHISGYVYAGIRGRVRGNSAETQPRLKHKGQLGDLFPTGMQQRLFFHVQVCVYVCNRSPLQL